MKTTRRIRRVFLTIFVAAAVSAVGLFFRQERQRRLDEELLVTARAGVDRGVLNLLDQGADPNARTRDNHAPTILGRLADVWQQMRGQPRSAARINSVSVLEYAVGTCDLTTIRSLLRHGAYAGTMADNGETVLAMAAREDNAPIVRLLLEYHADPNARLEYGLTALIVAKGESAKALLEHGAKADAICDLTTREDLHAPLVEAVARQDKIKIRALAEHGADVHVKLNQIRELLLSSYDIDDEILELMLEHYPDINGEDSNGQILLIHAIEDPRHRRRTVPILLRHGAKATLNNRFGVSALTVARKQVLTDILPHLEAAAKREVSSATSRP